MMICSKATRVDEFHDEKDAVLVQAAAPEHGLPGAFLWHIVPNNIIMIAGGFNLPKMGKVMRSRNRSAVSSAVSSPPNPKLRSVLLSPPACLLSASSLTLIASLSLGTVSDPSQ